MVTASRVIGPTQGSDAEEPAAYSEDTRDPLTILGSIDPQIESWRAQVSAARTRIENELAAKERAAEQQSSGNAESEALGPDYAQPLLVATREVLNQLIVAQNQVQGINLNLRRLVNTMTRLITSEGLQAENEFDVGGVVINLFGEYRNQVCGLWLCRLSNVAHLSWRDRRSKSRTSTDTCLKLHKLAQGSQQVACTARTVSDRLL